MKANQGGNEQTKRDEPEKIETMKIVMEVKYETEMNWIRFNTIAKMVNDEQS